MELCETTARTWTTTETVGGVEFGFFRHEFKSKWASGTQVEWIAGRKETASMVCKTRKRAANRAAYAAAVHRRAARNSARA